MYVVYMRPFYIVKASNFMNYMLIILNVGVILKIGMHVDNILHNPTTISKKCAYLI